MSRSINAPRAQRLYDSGMTWADVTRQLNQELQDHNLGAKITPFHTQSVKQACRKWREAEKQNAGRPVRGSATDVKASSSPSD
jgi:hypothetical protein